MMPPREIMSYTATLAIGENLRVKTSDGTSVAVCGAGEASIGLTVHATLAAGEKIAVIPNTHNGSRMMVAAGAFSAGAVLYAASAGRVDDVSSGSVVGTANQAATNAGDVVEVTIANVSSTDAANVSITDAGGYTTETTSEGAFQEIYAHLLDNEATITVPLTSLTYEDGTAYTKQATTVSGFAQLANKELVLLIPIDASAGDAAAFNVSVPQDLDETADLLVKVLVAKDADNDVLTLDCEVFPVGAGDLANADIQDTAAQTIVAAGTELTFTCGADGVLAAPGGLTVVLTQGGTNDGDAVHIHAVWLEYTRKLLS